MSGISDIIKTYIVAREAGQTISFTVMLVIFGLMFACFFGVFCIGSIVVTLATGETYTAPGN